MRDLWNGDRGWRAGNRRLAGRYFSIAGLLLICLLPLVLTACQDAAAASGLTVIMSSGEMGMSGGFSPRELHIFVGQTVTWVNKGTVHHTVTADDDAFNSGFIEPGASYTHTFLQPGRYPYHCVLHGSERGVGMAGVVVVTVAPPAGQPSP
jgi:plastocyanin